MNLILLSGEYLNLPLPVAVPYIRVKPLCQMYAGGELAAMVSLGLKTRHIIQVSPLHSKQGWYACVSNLEYGV